jgi:tight adherence protein C
MTPGIVAFFVFLTCLLVFFAIFSPNHEVKENAQTVVNPDIKKGFFEQWIRPTIRNLMPTTPTVITDYASKNGNISALLARSANPWNVTPEEYILVRILSVVVGVMIMVIFTVLHYFSFPLPLAILGGFVLGFMLPNGLLSSSWSKRKKEVRRTLPEALDLLRICMNAGNNFQHALEKTVLLLPPGTTKNELARVVAEAQAGVTVVDALVNFNRRCPIEEVDAFARAISQAQSTGSDIASTLIYQSSENRASYERAVEVRAQRLQTTLFLPIIGLFLPCLLIFTFGPALAQLSHSL